MIVNCNKCGGSRNIPDHVKKWQCPMCMKKHVIKEPAVIEEEPIETVEEPVELSIFEGEPYDSGE